MDVEDDTRTVVLSDHSRAFKGGGETKEQRQVSEDPSGVEGQPQREIPKNRVVWAKNSLWKKKLIASTAKNTMLPLE